MEITLSLPMLLFLMLMTGFAGFVDSAAGGGGLISLPAYLFAGLPVHYTYGTNKFSAACGTTFATAQSSREEHEHSGRPAGGCGQLCGQRTAPTSCSCSAIRCCAP